MPRLQHRTPSPATELKLQPCTPIRLCLQVSPQYCQPKAAFNIAVTLLDFAVDLALDSG